MSIRVRLALIFAAASAVVIVVGSLVYMQLLTHELHATIDSGLAAQTQSVRAQVSRVGASPRRVLRSMSALQRDDLAQIYGAGGTLVASSPTAGSAPLLDAATLREARLRPVIEDPWVRVAAGSDTTEHVRLMASPVQVPGGSDVVLVGTTLVWADAALDHISDTMLWAGPIVVVLFGVAAWLLAAAALRPVERMRRQVASMSVERGPSRVAVPATRDELSALARTMNGLLVRLQEALNRERAFAADAGHELRTPLAILCTELELASRPGRSIEELRDAVSHSAEESQRLARLATDLLDLARDDAGSSIQREPTSVESVVDAAQAQLALHARATGVSVVCTVRRDLVADIDPHRVRRLVENLLDNALRHVQPGGSVTVDTRTVGRGLEISVSDTGPGFPPEFLPHAFERFRRADASRGRDRGGTGLGLAIVKSIAEAHGGTVRATNRPGGGAEVTVQLPDVVVAGQLMQVPCLESRPHLEDSASRPRSSTPRVIPES